MSAVAVQAFAILCVFAFLLSGAAADDCAHRRDEAVACARKYCDLDHDGLISAHEIEEVRARTLHWYERLVAYVTDESTAVVMEHCDADGDGYISRADFERTERTCLRDCEAVTAFFKYVCDRARKAE